MRGEMASDPELWGGELDPPQRLSWHRKPQEDAAQDDAARAGASQPETADPEHEIRAARLPVKPDAATRAAAGAAPAPLTPAVVAGAGRRMAEARRGLRRRPQGH
jgi:hypothetical protein